MWLVWRAQFQHRGGEFLALSRALRAGGYSGHITMGGAFASRGWNGILGGGFGVDSVVLNEGEATITELLDALAGHRTLTGIAGLAFCDPAGHVVPPTPRDLADDLDALPRAWRYRPHSLQMGVPFIPISGGRGCWGTCTFCSITSALRDLRASGAHALYWRLRSPANLAAEMADLANAAGGSAFFCFHDETLLLPRGEATLARLREIRRHLDGHAVGRIALMGKCRSDTLDRHLAARLVELGVIRLYVGVETASQDGIDHYNRRMRVAAMHEALDACSEANIVASYNLLIFEPRTTLEDVAENAAFIRRHAEHPTNFCRAEPYPGTPLQMELQRQGRVWGNFLGWDYRLEDDRVELLLRMCMSAFQERNYGVQGIANRYGGLKHAALE